MTALDRTDVTARPLLRATLLTAVVAAAATSLVRLLGEATPATWEVLQAGSVLEVPVFAPALASVMGVAAGAVALWVLRRFSWGLTAWTVLAVLVGLGSVPQPLLAAEDGWTGALLTLMHPLVLVVALLLLRPAGRRAA